MATYKVKKLVAFNRSDIEWFESTHPGNSFWWFVNGLIGAYREIVEEEDTDPRQLMKFAAKRFKEIEIDK